MRLEICSLKATTVGQIKNENMVPRQKQSEQRSDHLFSLDKPLPMCVCNRCLTALFELTGIRCMSLTFEVEGLKFRSGPFIHDPLLSIFSWSLHCILVNKTEKPKTRRVLYKMRHKHLWSEQNWLLLKFSHHITTATLCPFSPFFPLYLAIPWVPFSPPPSHSLLFNLWLPLFVILSLANTIFYSSFPSYNLIIFITLSPDSLFLPAAGLCATN